MNRRKLLLIVFIVLAAVLLHRILTSPKGQSTSEHIEASQEPVQELAKNESRFNLDVSGYKWTVTPRANFQIAARILSTERYRMEWQSTLSPVDLALGWGKLSSPDADRWISWSQG